MPQPANADAFGLPLNETCRFASLLPNDGSRPMKPREKLLLLGLLATFGVLVVLPFLWKIVSGPVVAEQKRLDLINLQLRAEDDSFALAQAALTKMKDFKDRSLSSKPAEGALAYKQWLSDLAETVAKFGKPVVAQERTTLSSDKSYSVVRMKVSGEGTLEQLREFLFRFHRANVLHQISGLTIEAIDNSLQPRLRIALTADCLSLSGADIKGTKLFPRTELAEDLKADATQMRVSGSKGFPDKAPFEVRLGEHYLTVTQVKSGLWTIDRTESQKTLAAKTEDVIELAPIHPDYADKKLGDYDSLIKENPFAKPVPYRPKLDLVGDKSVVRGGSLNLEPKATGFDVRGGAAKFVVTSELPAGMTFTDGKLAWAPPAELKAGTFKVAITATAPGLKEPLKSEFELTLKDINLAPKAEAPSGLVATIGQPLAIALLATDAETPTDKLKFKLNDPKPEGASINEANGEITWTPAAATPPGPATISVSITDAGTPPSTTILAVAITVQDDTAVFTFLTASVAADDEKQAWLYDRSSNSRLILREGKPLKYAGFDAVVKTIAKDFVLFTQKDKTWRIDVGQNLREAKVMAQPDDKKPADTATTPATDKKPEAEKPEAAKPEAPKKKPEPEKKPDAEKPTAEKPEPK